VDVSCGDKFTVVITQQRVGIFTNIRKLKKLHDFKKKFPDYKASVKPEAKEIKSNR
jgi:hypothetical protein